MPKMHYNASAFLSYADEMDTVERLMADFSYPQPAHRIPRNFRKSITPQFNQFFNTHFLNDIGGRG